MDWSTVVKKSPKHVHIQSSSKHTSLNSQQQKPCPQTEAEKNEKDQRLINNDVLVSGFTTEPAQDYWMELINKAEMSQNEVQGHSRFSLNGKYFIIIEFKDKESQKDFVDAVRSKKLNYKNSSTRIYAQNRLTKFNSSVLRTLNSSSGITAFKLDGYLFKAKLTSTSTWTTIDTKQKLQDFITAAEESQKITHNSERITNLNEQQALDRQIILHGFSYIPKKVDDIIERFMRHFNLTLKHVTGYRVVTSNQILIKLSETSIQMEILAPIERKIQLQKLMPENKSNMSITWDRALTEFNENVNKSLTKALRDEKIEKFEFVGYRFCVLVDQSLPWISVGCNSDLDEVFNRRMSRAGSIGSLGSSMSRLSVNSY